MSDKKVEGSTASALAAHSEDASASGTNPAASATGKEGVGAAVTPGEGSDAVTRFSKQAQDAANRFATSTSDAADQARRYISEHGNNAAQQAAAMVRQQPVAVLLATAAVGMILGILLSRR
jgi:ElaB/YqjD/DUF883 family membrane-anchored ribosome-binding protein